MGIEGIREIIKGEEYDFLRNNEHLGKNVILLGLGGSHAYGLNTPESDIDIRGCALNSKREILLGKGFEQVENKETDTVIYSFNKMISLLCNCNPNVLEIFGLKSEHYLYISPFGQELLDNKDLFLSKRAIKSFGGYAVSQLYRLQQKTLCALSEEEYNEHICKVINQMIFKLESRYGLKNVKVFVENGELKITTSIEDFPLEDLAGLLSEINNTSRDYKKKSKRNEYAINHKKAAKHSVNLIRLQMMAIDLLENKEIITYREKEHDLLMDIRFGKYLDSDDKPNSAFFDVVREYEKKFDYAKNNTELPEEPDMDKINDFVMSVNERIVRGNTFD